MTAHDPKLSAVKPYKPVNGDIIGHDTSEWQELLSRKMTFAVGKDAQTKIWKAKATMALSGWLNARPTPKGAGYGLTQHIQSEKKEGSCIVFGALAGQDRVAKAVITVDAIGLDVDSGEAVEHAINCIKEAGWAAVAYSTFSDMGTESEVPRDDVLAKLDLDRDPTTEELRAYLRDYCTSYLTPEIIDSAEIVDGSRHTSKGVRVVFSHVEREKYRIVFFLGETLKIMDLAGTHKAALDAFGDLVRGLAQIAGVHADPACTDPSRLFYLPRHPKGAKPYTCVVRGRGITVDDIPRVPDQKKASRKKSGPILTPSGKDLRHYPREKMALGSFFDAEASEIVRGSNGDKVFAACPNESRHSDSNDTDAFAMDGDGDAEKAVWHCSHGGCQADGTLERLAAAMEAGIIDEDLFFLPECEGGAMIVGDDELADDDDAGDFDPASAGSKDLPLLQQVEDRFAEGADEESVIKFMRKSFRRGADAFERQRITDALFKVTGLGKRAIAKLWKTAEKEEAEHREANDPEAVRRLDIRTSDEIRMVEAAVSGLREANETDPSLFHYVDTLATIRPDAEGHARLNVFGSGAKLKHEINRLELYSKAVPDGDGTENVRALVPDHVAQEVWSNDFTDYALPLRGLKTTPFFTSEGVLVVANGYDKGSMTVLATPTDTSIPAHVLDPNWCPSKDDAKAAVRYLVAEVFADFPIDGDKREELLRKLDAGEDTPSLCALMAMTLLPFMRQMINGPTPGHFLAKPKPGTGASLLTELVCIIAMGRAMPAMALPENRDETDKTITSILTEGREIAYFDNINHSIDSGTLASAMSSRNYGARILGKTQTVDTPVNCMWVLTGNNVTMSGELLRRCIAIMLDANMGNPGEGRTFEKDNIARWVAEHRWELVTASLTIIKHWVALGCPAGAAKTLASYEDWSRKMGGVLEAAGLRGFMTNLADWKDEATDETDDGQMRLLTLLAEYPVGTVFRPDGTDAPRNVETGEIETGKIVSICDVLNEAGDPLKDGEAIILAGWSYKELFDDVSDKVRVRYSNSAQVSKRFRALARSPSVVGSGEDRQTLAFEERTGKKGGTRYWVRVEASD